MRGRRGVWQIVAWLLLVIVAPALQAKSAVVVTDHVRAELVVNAPDGIAAGKAVQLGLAIQHIPHWHTYWKNAGDSGLPTTMEWTVPKGFAVGAIAWPTPQRLPVGPLVNYGYEGSLLLPVTLTVPAQFNDVSIAIDLRADWLVCEVICIPESGTFHLTVSARTPLTGHAALFAQSGASMPKNDPNVRADARLDGKDLMLRVSGMPAAMVGKSADVFIANAGVIDHGAPAKQMWENDILTVRLPLSSQRSESPQTMGAVIKVPGQMAGVEVSFTVVGNWNRPGEAAQPKTQPNPDAGLSLAFVLALAFAGGVLLNLMPCVFPVLSFKLLRFAQDNRGRAQHAASGIAYTAGVVAAFVGLAALLISLRAGGEQLGWGFQLQSPLFVVALAGVFALIGLNLAGVFEVGSVLPSRIASAHARHPLLDDVLSGVLAVAIASPCTAPFMGAAVGTALTLPTAAALSAFAFLGLGMAAPYLLASMWPGLARRLPRPGAWMVTFRSLMAFPMFATVVWLLWVLGHQTGIDAVAAALAMLLALSLAAWTVGAAQMSTRSRRCMLSLSLAILLATGGWTWQSLELAQENPPAAVTGRSGAAVWQPWSPDAVLQARNAGRTVFVDFTAAWCITCQFNKRTVLADPAVLADFVTKDVVLLRADWTRRDATISQELTRLGRSGVPVYAVYRPGATQPQLLPELLNAELVRAALSAP